MADPRLAKIMLAQHKNFNADPYPHLLAISDEQDLRIWYFLVGGLDDPFLHGEFIFKLTAPDSFPEKPPRFEFCTENGVFHPTGPICISVGEYHTNDRPGKTGAYGWRPALGMKGFAIQVVNGLICYEGLESGIRIQNSSAAEKKAFAKNSRATNARKFPDLYRRFEEIITESPDIEPVRNIVAARARLEGKAPPEYPLVNTAGGADASTDDAAPAADDDADDAAADDDAAPPVPASAASAPSVVPTPAPSIDVEMDDLIDSLLGL
jgi:ubiquitin-protein ligase